jgi:hypothetical protein
MIFGIGTERTGLEWNGLAGSENAVGLAGPTASFETKT